jgi:hypothetical protein
MTELHLIRLRNALRSLARARRALALLTAMPDPEIDHNNPRSEADIDAWVSMMVDAQAMLWSVSVGRDLISCLAPPSCLPWPRRRAASTNPTGATRP